MSDKITRLHATVLSHRDLDPAKSRTARLFAAGPKKIAKKVGEEAVEVALDAISGNRDGIINESADLLYNLVVLWASAGVTPAEVFAEMDRREELYGIAEKLAKQPGGSTLPDGPLTK